MDTRRRPSAPGAYLCRPSRSPGDSSAAEMPGSAAAAESGLLILLCMNRAAVYYVLTRRIRVEPVGL
jgi:hypothetical protein